MVDDNSQYSLEESRELYDTLLNVPQWMIDAGVPRKPAKKLKKSDLISRHGEWADGIIKSMELEDKNLEDRVKSLLQFSDYADLIAEDPRCADYQANIFMLAKPLVEGFKKRIRIYKELGLKDLYLNLSEKDVSIEEYASLIQNFFHYAIQQHTTISDVDPIILRKLLNANMSKLPISATPEALVDYIVRVDKFGLMEYVRQHLGEYAAPSDREIGPSYLEDLLDDFSQRGIDPRNKEVAAYRVSMLKEGPIYIKPVSGARANLVMKVTYYKDNNEISVESEDIRVHQLIRLSNSKILPKLLAQRIESDEFEKSIYLSLSELDKLADPESDFEIEISFGKAELAHKKGVSEERYLLAFIPRETIGKGKNIPIQVISLNSYQFTQKGANETRIKVVPEHLEEILFQLEGIYLSAFTQSYAESEIKTPLIYGGKTWEIRTINQATDLKHPKVVAMYCKIGRVGIVSSISKGGFGQEAELSVEEAYRNLRPELNDAQRKKLVRSYIQEVKKAALRVNQAISDYLAELRGGLPNFPLDDIVAADIATDFKGQIIETPKGFVLKPILVEPNFYYGMTGLEDSVSRERVLRNKRIIMEKVVEAIRAY